MIEAVIALYAMLSIVNGTPEQYFRLNCLLAIQLAARVFSETKMAMFGILSSYTFMFTETPVWLLLDTYVFLVILGDHTVKTILWNAVLPGLLHTIIQQF